MTEAEFLGTLRVVEEKWRLRGEFGNIRTYCECCEGRYECSPLTAVAEWVLGEYYPVEMGGMAMAKLCLDARLGCLLVDAADNRTVFMNFPSHYAKDVERMRRLLLDATGLSQTAEETDRRSCTSEAGATSESSECS